MTENEKAELGVVTTDGPQLPALAPTKMSIIQNAIEQGYGADALTVLERMFELQIRDEANEARKAYAEDMASCQSEMPVVYERRENKHTNSKYAAYKDLARESKPVYTTHGFSVSFCEAETNKPDHIRLKARVIHRMGHIEEHWCDIPIDDKGPSGSKNKTLTHGVKSASSYGRGMLLAQIFNIPTSDDVDDDGNGAGGYEKMTEDHVLTINALIEEVGADTQRLLKFYKVESIADMPDSWFNNVAETLERKRNK